MHTPDHRHDETPGRGVRPAPAEEGDRREANEVLELQRSVGNAVTSRFVEFARQAEQAEEAEEAPAVQRSSVDEVVGSRGDSLPVEVKRVAEASYGDDFSGVRVHRDAVAVRSARELSARAYTTGEHVVMPPGSDDLHTWLHELDHVRQQRRGAVEGTDRGDGVQVSHPSDRHEKEADTNATQALQGHASPANHQHTGHQHTGHDTPAVQRSPLQWANSDPVLNAMREDPGRAQKSYWPQIRDAIQEYTSIDADVAGPPGTQSFSEITGRRRQLLQDLEDAIAAWRDNQGRKKVTFPGDRSTRKSAILDQLSGMITTERQEISAAERITNAPPQASQPMGIGIPGRSAEVTGKAVPSSKATTSSGEPPTSSDEENDWEDGQGRSAQAEPESYTQEMKEARALCAEKLGGVEELVGDIDVHTHFTRKSNVKKIRHEGLRAGGSKGIGLPEELGGGSDTDFTYTVSGSPSAARFVAGEVGTDSDPSTAVGVIGSNLKADPDTNYKRGGAYRHPGDLPPVRRAGRDDSEATAFSFTLPATAKQKAGVAKVVNLHRTARGMEEVSEDVAYRQVLARMWRRMDILVTLDVAEALRNL